MELNKIYNEDCLEGMKRIPDGSVDCIICDLPYGTMKGISKSCNGWKSGDTEWDETIPTGKLFEQYGRILRRGGTAVLFSQEPYTSHLRTFKGTWMTFTYPLIWKKEHPGNIMGAKTAPLNYYEDINIFRRRSINDSEKAHPLRSYAKNICDYIGKSAKEVIKDFQDWNIYAPTRIQHFLAYDALQFSLCTSETYDLLIEHYHIDKMKFFRLWEDLQKEHSIFVDSGKQIFNLPPGKSSVSNILEFNKDYDTFHPTQKPVDLIRYLVLTYTNEGDTVLDNCMGSGTTAIACIKEKRNFIGFELNKEYYDKACKRIDLEQRQLTLF